MQPIRPLLAALFLAVCALPAAAQTIKTLGFNTTNGQIVAATNPVWTNSFSFSTNTVAAQVRTNLGLGATWLTNTNVTNFRSAIGLGATNDVVFGDVQAVSFLVGDATNSQIVFEGNSAATTRTNLGLGLPALTNTSNVTMMRALAGSTNTNQPYSGTINFSNVIGMTISNGIIIGIEEP